MTLFLAGVAAGLALAWPLWWLAVYVYDVVASWYGDMRVAYLLRKYHRDDE